MIHNPNEVTIEDIEQLNPVQLSDLLLRLLKFESEKFKFDGVEEILVPLKINVADEGEDGRIKCNSTNGSMWITNNLSIYQNKATDLQPKEVYNEFFKDFAVFGAELKSQIKEVLDAGGQYVFFISHSYNKCLIKNRLKYAYKAIDDSNIKYNTAYTHSQIRIIEGNQIKDWTNQFTNAVIYVHGCLGRSHPVGLRTIEQWGEYKEYRDTPFISNTALEKLASAMININHRKNESIRLIGHSGLGKSRLVYETFKIDRKISHNAVYYEIVESAEGLIQYIRSCAPNFEGVLIVDNCDYASHKLLEREIHRSANMSMITIDNSVEEILDNSKTSQTKYLELKSDDLLDTIPKLLGHFFAGQLTNGEINYISEYSAGYPYMALLFAQAFRTGNSSFTEFIQESFEQKLLFGRDYNKPGLDVPSKYNLIRLLSIFGYFYMPAQKIKSTKAFTDKEISRFNLQNELIFNHLVEPAQTARMFSETCEYFIRKQILEQRGNTLRVRPEPLALKLSADWLKHTTSEFLLSSFPGLIEHQLATPFADRLKNLDQLPEANQIVEDLWGDIGPFGTAEVLNTELGSRLFRSIVEVNPEIAAKTLVKAFRNLSKEEVFAIDAGRRNLVWAIEKLCFRKETFIDAAKILCKFAISENENWSNNATGQFLQLFQIHLPGTQADFDARITIIDWMLKLDDPAYTTLAISAMGRALKRHYFHRMSGAEKQGSSIPLEDYIPSRDSIENYLSKILQMMSDLYIQSVDSRQLILDQTAQNIRGLVNCGAFDLICKFIQSLLPKISGIWQSGIDSLRTTLQYEQLSVAQTIAINELIDELMPKDYLGKIKSIVDNPDWDFKSGENGELVDYSELRAIDLAREFLQNNVSVSDYLPALLVGEQRAAVSFGREIGKNLAKESKNTLIKEIISLTSKIEKKNQNPNFLWGILDSCPEEQRRLIIISVLSNEKMAINGVLYARLYFNDIKDFYIVTDLAENDVLSPKELVQLCYAQYFSEAPISIVDEMCKRLCVFGNAGEWLAIELLHNSSLRNESRLMSYKNIIISVTSNQNYFIGDSQLSDISEYRLAELVKSVIKQSGNAKYARTLSRQLREFFKGHKHSFSYSYISEISSVLVQNYFNEFWQEISKTLTNDRYSFWQIADILGSHHGNFNNKDANGILFGSSHNALIIEWCKNNKPIGPLKIAKMMPIWDNENTEADIWHPFALEMIDNFGDQEDFLKAVSFNLGAYSFTGSIVPYYQSQIELMNKLLQHSIPKVIQWAQDQIAELEKIKTRRRIGDEEMFL
ncbi:MAG: hypothetical protein LWX56_12100 [Ignavibacteria bacterium]|nr:hypothetical protein [Ignavibacteria bacterium]